MAFRWTLQLLSLALLTTLSGCACFHHCGDYGWGCGSDCGTFGGGYSQCVVDTGCGACGGMMGGCDQCGHDYGSVGYGGYGGGLAPIHRARMMRQRKLQAQQVAHRYRGDSQLVGYGQFDSERGRRSRRSSRRHHDDYQYGYDPRGAYHDDMYDDYYGMDDMYAYEDFGMHGLMDGGCNCNAGGDITGMPTLEGGWVDAGEWQEGTYTDGQWVEQKPTPAAAPPTAAEPTPSGEPVPMPTTYEPYYMPRTAPEYSEVSQSTPAGQDIQPVLYVPGGL
ncbi:MAG: hypothetical protein R3B90_19715 [Planctomycetaceae bacterium]